MTSSNGNIFRVTGLLWGESTGHRWIPSQRSVTRSFDIFFDLHLNKRLSKQSRCRWFETLSRSSWYHWNVWRYFDFKLNSTTNLIPCVKWLTSQHWVRFWPGAYSTISISDKYTTVRYDNAVIMGTMASQITSLMIVYSIVYSGADKRKHQSSASLAFVRGIHRWPVNSPHKWPVTRKMFPFDDVIMQIRPS